MKIKQIKVVDNGPYTTTEMNLWRATRIFFNMDEHIRKDVSKQTHFRFPSATSLATFWQGRVVE